MYTKENGEISFPLSSKEDDTGAEGHGRAQTGGRTDDGGRGGAHGRTDGRAEGKMVMMAGRVEGGAVGACVAGRTEEQEGRRVHGGLGTDGRTDGC